MAEPLHNYTQNARQGENFDQQLSLKEIAQIIRKELKSKFKQCKFSVTTERYANGQSLNISLMSAPCKVISHDMVHDFKDGEEIWVRRENSGHSQLSQYSFSNPRHEDPESCWAEKDYHNSNGAILTDYGWDVMKYVSELALSYNYDDSDGMIDYFNTNFYLHLNIGKWDKKFVQTN